MATVTRVTDGVYSSFYDYDAVNSCLVEQYHNGRSVQPAENANTKASLLGTFTGEHSERNIIISNAGGLKKLSLSDGQAETLKTLYMKTGEAVPTFSVHGKTEYKLSGYYTQSEGGDQILDANGRGIPNATISRNTVFDENGKWKYQNDLTLYAHWAKIYAIYYSFGEIGISYSGYNDGVLPTSASAGDTVNFVVTVPDGYEIDSVTVSTDSGDYVDVIKNNGYYSFIMPDLEVSINVTAKRKSTYPGGGASTPKKEDKPAKNPFVDVKATDFFYDAVLWAAENGITSGVDATHFAPSAKTSRAQMITFLWRMAGSPVFEDDDIKFADIKSTDYFYNAVVWGWNMGIVSGKSETKFAPDDDVSRGEAVTFIYRYAKVAGGDLSNPFTDLKAGEFYYYPVLWAANNEITSGTTATTFSPSEDCTRGQIVTFLYRYNNKYN
ncbi:MAG: S-layer homology domain-containing protein [Bacillota bacterium]|nr:S-layer homology domain-containing protein [Bacillota bacterium]